MPEFNPETKIIKGFSPEEFRVIYHRELNNMNPILQQLFEATDYLRPKISRKLITTLEGDIIEYKGKPYLGHILYAKYLTRDMFFNKFIKQESSGKAAHVYDVLYSIKKNYNESYGPLEFEVELKDNLSEKTLITIVDLFKSSKIPHYYASFYSKNLDMIYDIDSDAIRARHVYKTKNDEGFPLPILGTILGMDAPRHDPDINIVRYNKASGYPTHIIYTAMHPSEQLIKFSKESNVMGAFTDIELFKSKKAV